MSAVVFSDSAAPVVAQLLARLRSDLGRAPGQVLHWKKITRHSQRLHAAQVVGAANFLTLSTVVVLKRYFTQGQQPMAEDPAYLYTLRYLLERLSWIARDRQRPLNYMLAHVVRFRIASLREYESILRTMTPPDCRIEWSWIPKPGRIDQPSRTEALQLADIVASATAAAFEPDGYGNTERRYLEAFASRLYRYGTRPNALTSYGLKMHPWNASANAAYPWVDDL